MRITNTMIISWRLRQFSALRAAGVADKDACKQVQRLSKSAIRRRIAKERETKCIGR